MDENRPTLRVIQPGTKCDFCAWDGVELTERHSLRCGKMRREMIMLWDDHCLNDYLELDICFLCKFYMLKPREHLDWIIDSQMRRTPSPEPKTS